MCSTIASERYEPGDSQPEVIREIEAMVKQRLPMIPTPPQQHVIWKRESVKTSRRTLVLQPQSSSNGTCHSLAKYLWEAPKAIF